MALGGRRPHSCSSINLAGNFGIYAIRAAELFRKKHIAFISEAKSIFNLICLCPKRLQQIEIVVLQTADWLTD
jgi:hypothetical protein